MTEKDVVETEDKPKTLGEIVKKELREWGATLSVFIPLFMIFSTFAYELRVIPSESMVPSLQVGDRVTVNKFAYGFSRNSLPFSLGRYVPLPDGRIFGSEPEPGDVVVFEHPHTQRVMIKRLIGAPGDEIQLQNKQIYRNGQPISRTFERRVKYIPHGENSRMLAEEWRETIGDQSWIAHDLWFSEGRDRPSSLDNTARFKVPEGYYLFMGDNRDNSADGRALDGHCDPNPEGVIDEAGCERPESATVGFVPYTNLIGRADTVLFTTYRCSNNSSEPCMKKRLWRGL